jgi:ferredoxin-fold anticodon binding domain-containing protein
MIKYIKINDKNVEQKILFGFIISVSVNEVVMKSVGTGPIGKKGFIWKIKINNNYIFVKNPYTNKLRELLEDKFMDLLVPTPNHINNNHINNNQ